MIHREMIRKPSLDNYDHIEHADEIGMVYIRSLRVSDIEKAMDEARGDKALYDEEFGAACFREVEEIVRRREDIHENMKYHNEDSYMYRILSEEYAELAYYDGGSVEYLANELECYEYYKEELEICRKELIKRQRDKDIFNRIHYILCN